MTAGLPVGLVGSAIDRTSRASAGRCRAQAKRLKTKEKSKCFRRHRSAFRKVAAGAVRVSERACGVLSCCRLLAKAFGNQSAAWVPGKGRPGRLLPLALDGRPPQLMTSRVIALRRSGADHAGMATARRFNHQETTMSAIAPATDLTALADRYLAAWNETDPARRRDLIARTWADSASYADPLMQGTGHGGIDAMIAAVQARFPDFRFTRVTPVDAHGRYLRFTWELGPEGQAALVVGTDFATVDDDGRLQSMTGFIDRAPAGMA